MRAFRWPLAAFLVGAMVVVVSAQQPGGRQGGKGGLSGQVLTNAALQEELKITEEQKTKLKAAAEKAGAGIKEAFKDAGGDKEKMTALFAKMQEDNAKAVNEVLTADQKARLKQVERQVSGVRAFGNDEMVADLKLEDGQKTKIKGIVDEYSKDVRELGGFGGFGKTVDKEKQAEAAKKREKLEKGAIADIDEVLNDSQRKTWKDLSGPPVADIAKVRAGAFNFGGGIGGKGKQTPKKD